VFNKRENIFYVAIGIATVMNEIAIETDVYVCLSLPLTLGMIAVGLWAFPKENLTTKFIPVNDSNFLSFPIIFSNKVC